MVEEPSVASDPSEQKPSAPLLINPPQGPTGLPPGIPGNNSVEDEALRLVEGRVIDPVEMAHLVGGDDRAIPEEKVRFNHVDDPVKKPKRKRGPQQKNKRHRRVSRLGLDGIGQFSYRSLKFLPPIELDEEGFPIRPRPITEGRRRKFSEEERKVRFVLIWSYTAGNVLLACQEAGILRSVYLKWKSEDPIFTSRLEDARKDIADRVYLRFTQRVALVRIAPGLKVHDSALGALMKKYCPELMPEGESVSEPVQAESNVPRPTR